MLEILFKDGSTGPKTGLVLVMGKLTSEEEPRLL